jgi:Flp pilus assembly protein TadD
MSQVARRYYERGRNALGNLDLESAQESLRAAIDLAPHYGDARIAYAVALSRAGDHPRAAGVLRVGLGRACSPILAAAQWCTLGDVLTASGDFFGAEDAFHRARQTPGFTARSASGLARVYGKLGRFGDMAKELKLAAIASIAVAT